VSNSDASSSPSGSDSSDVHMSAVTSVLAGVDLLVVDDAADNCEVVKYLLEMHGAKVAVAYSAVDALRAIENARFDAVVSDIAMPVNDGYWLLSEIRRREPPEIRPLPVVALTAMAGDENRARAEASGFAAHLSKPTSDLELVSVIKDVLEPAA
jgi:two-component system, chemotaxis family, CheB/CheR fusion protein